MARNYRDEFSMALFNQKRRPTLDPSEFERLFLEVKSDDTKVRDAAIERIALANLGLVISIAKRYVVRGLPLSDLVQEGLIQLITRAIPGFDITRENTFSTYATPSLKRAFGKACAEKGEGKLVYLPAYIRYKEYLVAKAKREFLASLGRSPDAKEIHAILQTYESKTARRITVQEIDKIINSPSLETVSLSQPPSESRAPRVEEKMLARNDGNETDSPAMAAEQFGILSERLNEELRQMTIKERDTIVNRFGLSSGIPRTLDTVGGLYGLTRERIRQIERSVIRRIAKRWKMTYDAVKETLISLCEMGFRTQLQNNPKLTTKMPSTHVSSQVLSEHAVVLQDAKYVVKPARTLAARLDIDEETAQLAVEACAREGAFAFVEGCDAIRL